MTPATEKQLRFLADLGLPGRDRASRVAWLREQGLTRDAASELIEQAKVGGGEQWDALCDAAMDAALAKQNPSLSGAQIKKVARAVLEEYPQLRMGPYARWRKEDGYWDYVVVGHPDWVLSFDNILAGHFSATPQSLAPMSWRGTTISAEGITTEAELAEFIRDAVDENAELLEIEAPDLKQRLTRMPVP